MKTVINVADIIPRVAGLVFIRRLAEDRRLSEDRRLRQRPVPRLSLLLRPLRTHVERVLKPSEGMSLMRGIRPVRAPSRVRWTSVLIEGAATVAVEGFVVPQRSMLSVRIEGVSFAGSVAIVSIRRRSAIAVIVSAGVRPGGRGSFRWVTIAPTPTAAPSLARVRRGLSGYSCASRHIDSLRLRSIRLFLSRRSLFTNLRFQLDI